MSWYIGQSVVALKTITSTHGFVGIVEGKIYTIVALRNSFCRCIEVEILVDGISKQPSTMSCQRCNTTLPYDLYDWFISEHRFAPIEEIPASHEQAIEELLKRELINN